jgi:hypothetical protein
MHEAARHRRGAFDEGCRHRGAAKVVEEVVAGARTIAFAG